MQQSKTHTRTILRQSNADPTQIQQQSNAHRTPIQLLSNNNPIPKIRHQSNTADLMLFQCQFDKNFLKNLFVVTDFLTVAEIFLLAGASSDYLQTHVVSSKQAKALMHFLACAIFIELLPGMQDLESVIKS